MCAGVVTRLVAKLTAAHDTRGARAPRPRRSARGNDMGTQYRHGLYPHSAGQYAAARRCVERVQATVSPRRVVTEIKPAAVFWPAEGYHQRYLQKGGQDASKGSAEKVRCYG